MDEDVSFLNKGSIAFTLDDLPDNSSVIIDGSKSHSIDLDVIEIIHNFRETAKLRNISLQLIAIPEFKRVTEH